MGVCWFLSSTGHKFHMPVVGNDINTPSNPISVGVLVSEDRCLSGQVQVVTPQHGTVTIDFDPPGRTGGPCEQCGQCCVHPVADCPMPPDNCGYVLDTNYNVHKCQYLTIAPGANKLGKKNGTECSLRATIFDNFKGCTLGPETRRPHMTSCPFVYPGE